MEVTRLKGWASIIFHVMRRNRSITSCFLPFLGYGPEVDCVKALILKEVKFSPYGRR